MSTPVPTSCGVTAPVDLCPDLDQCHALVLRHLPRGLAWASHHRPGTVAWAFWRAVAHLFHYAATRVCAAREEFFCATHSETHAEWMRDYGLPDGCDPFPDLCTKVAALGGTRCEYYAALAARAGWSISCDDGLNGCGSETGCDEAGCAEPGEVPGAARLKITIHLRSSEAYTAPLDMPSEAGCMEAGMAPPCPPDVSPLVCLLSRVVHAHLDVTYETKDD